MLLCVLVWLRLLLLLLLLPSVVVGHPTLVHGAARVIRRSAGCALRGRAGYWSWHIGGHLWRCGHWFNLPWLSWL